MHPYSITTPAGYRPHRPIAERFWPKVDKSGECWIWRGAKNRNGYGTFMLGEFQARAHRVAYELTYGPILDRLMVCHHCDNPPCCNPAHLFLGTVADNAADMVKKGRQARGDHHGFRLHPESVLRGQANGNSATNRRLRQHAKALGSAEETRA
jgi:hypothetical protein